MFKIKFPTKRIFRIFPILRINGMAPFCNLLMERPSYLKQSISQTDTQLPSDEHTSDDESNESIMLNCLASEAFHQWALVTWTSDRTRAMSMNYKTDPAGQT